MEILCHHKMNEKAPFWWENKDCERSESTAVATRRTDRVRLAETKKAN